MHPQEETHLQWAIIDGKLRNVSDFVGIQPKKRPPALCPVCLRPVTLKLGKVRAHHCAHQPGDECAATQSETAKHLNTKFHIYSQLQQTQKLHIERICEGRWHRGCQATKPETWLKNWDTVEVEHTIGSFRPDIALLREGTVIGAIEVLVTHAVDEAKNIFFQQQNIPWLEIRADEALYEGETAWTCQQPLPYDRQQPEMMPWECNECIQRDQAEKEQIAYQQKNYEAIHAAKMVDIYYTSGRKYREVYYVMKRVENGEWAEAWVKTEKGTIGPREKGPITPASLKKLSAIVAKRLDSFRHMEGVTVVDDFMGAWRRWEPDQRFSPRDTTRYPFRYVWRRDIGKWIEIG